MIQKFVEANYEIVDFDQFADIYVINTCTVTNISDRKSRQMLRRAKDLNEAALVVAVGCYAQVAKEDLEQIEEIDLILGTNEKKDIVNYVEKCFGNNEKKGDKYENRIQGTAQVSRARAENRAEKEQKRRMGCGAKRGNFRIWSASGTG